MKQNFRKGEIVLLNGAVWSIGVSMLEPGSILKKITKKLPSVWKLKVIMN